MRNTPLYVFIWSSELHFIICIDIEGIRKEIVKLINCFHRIQNSDM